MKFIIKEIFTKEYEIEKSEIEDLVSKGNALSTLDKVEDISMEDVAAILRKEDTDYDLLHVHFWQTWAEFIAETIYLYAVYADSYNNNKKEYCVETAVIE